MDEREEAKLIGATLSGLRQSLGFTQLEMAQKAGVSPSTYLRHERGRKAPSAKLLERYTRELGFKMAEFYQLHDMLQRARARTKAVPEWWRSTDPGAPETHPEDEQVRERFGQQLAQLQADIYQLLFQRHRS